METIDSPSESRKLDPKVAQSVAGRLRQIADDLDEASGLESVDDPRASRAKRTSGRMVNPITDERSS